MRCDTGHGENVSFWELSEKGGGDQPKLKIVGPFLRFKVIVAHIFPHALVCLQSAHYGLRKLILCCKKSFFVSAPLCLQSVSTTVSSSSQPSDVYISPLTHVYFDIEAIHRITDTVQWCVYFYIISSTLSPLQCLVSSQRFTDLCICFTYARIRFILHWQFYLTFGCPH